MNNNNRSESVHSFGTVTLKHVNRIQSFYYSLCGVKYMKEAIDRTQQFCRGRRSSVVYGRREGKTLEMCSWKRMWHPPPPMQHCRANSLQAKKIKSRLCFHILYRHLAANCLDSKGDASVCLLWGYWLTNSDCIKVYKVTFCPVRG